MSASAAAPSATRPAPVVRAGIVSRGGAFTTDLVILGMIARAVAELALVLRSALPHLGPRLHVGPVLLALAPVLFAVYHVTFWLLWSTTPGEWLFGLEVVSVGGGRLRPVQSIARVFAYLVSALPFYAGFLWVLTPGRRTWHDILTGTAVIYKR